MNSMKDISKEQKERMTKKRHFTLERVQGRPPKSVHSGSERNDEKVPAGKILQAKRTRTTLSSTEAARTFERLRDWKT